MAVSATKVDVSLSGHTEYKPKVPFVLLSAMFKLTTGTKVQEPQVAMTG